MIITFMVGNGLDISLGLKTKYTDFYEYYFNKKKNVKNDIMKSINNDFELWANLEKRLGEYTSRINSNEKEIDKFYDDKYDLDCELRKYLRKEQEKIDWNNENNINNVKKNFLSCLTNFYHNFSEVDREDIESVISNEQRYYRLISFNYTNVIQKCSELSESNLIETLYIHGTLEGEKTILGVNDSEQIENVEFRNNQEMLVSMCKLNINDFYGNKVKVKAQNILLRSGVICIFGMSLGETDKYWWNIIVNGLFNDNIQRIIIFNYEPELNLDFNVRVLRTQNKIKEQLLSYSNLSDNEKELIKDKIKVICNKNIFDLNLELKDDNNSEKVRNERQLVMS